MFDDEDDVEDTRGAGDNVSATDARLVQFVERYERLDEEKKGIADDQKDVVTELKSLGYDGKVFKQLIRDRKKNRDDLAAERAMYDGMACAIGLMFE